MSKKVSWKEYVDNALMSSGVITKAAIMGLDNGKKWASSPNFEVDEAEAKYLIDGFLDPTDLRAEGILLDGQYLVCVRADRDLIMGRQSGGGCIIAKCKQLIIISMFDDPYEANCCNLICKLATFLRDRNF